MANIQCACTGNKIRLKKKSPDRAMANATATIIGHQGTAWGQDYSNLIRSTIGPWVIHVPRYVHQKNEKNRNGS